MNNVIILIGKNGCGKTAMIQRSIEDGFVLYEEKLTSGVKRRNDVLEFCRVNNKVAIDNIELYLDISSQRDLINSIIEVNPNINLLCSTHSPTIYYSGWVDCIRRM